MDKGQIENTRERAWQNPQRLHHYVQHSNYFPLPSAYLAAHPDAQGQDVHSPEVPPPGGSLSASRMGVMVATCMKSTWGSTEKHRSMASDISCKPHTPPHRAGPKH